MVTRRPGATVGFYVWDYPGGGMELMRAFWAAATALNPRARDLGEGGRFPSCTPEGLTALMKSAGFARIECAPITVSTVFRDFDDYWQPFLMATAPAPRHVMSLSDADRTDLRERLRARLPTEPDGSIPLTARGWAVRATA